MIINVLDGCYIVFDTKNRNIKLYTLQTNLENIAGFYIDINRCG